MRGGAALAAAEISTGHRTSAPPLHAGVNAALSRGNGKECSERLKAQGEWSAVIGDPSSPIGKR